MVYKVVIATLGTENHNILVDKHIKQHIPVGSIVLDIQAQNSDIVMWYKATNVEVTQAVRIHAVQTGFSTDYADNHKMNYYKTLSMNNSHYILHLFVGEETKFAR